MQSSFTLRKSELTMDFLQGLKQMFPGSVLDITVRDNTTDEMDETAYLLSDPANRKLLLDGIKAIEKGNVEKVALEAL
ncbi:MAG: hypothetical protein K2K67_09470 [Treponemataceae bacterium]|nr:hypothetical protein [Treponemataceae bacterium]